MFSRGFSGYHDWGWEERTTNQASAIGGKFLYTHLKLYYNRTEPFPETLAMVSCRHSVKTCRVLHANNLLYTSFFELACKDCKTDNLGCSRLEGLLKVHRLCE